MKNGQSRTHRVTWGAIVLAMALLTAASVTVPQAFAEGTDTQSADVRRYFQIIESAYQFITQNYVDEVDAKKLYEGAMKGMMEALGDPYSVYLDEASWNYLNDTTVVGKFGGIGLSIAKQALPAKAAPDTPSYVEIFSVFDGTPGWKAGFKPGDLIIKIEGESTAPLIISEAQSKLRGEPGTKVTMTVRRGETEFDLSVIRAVIEIPTVKSGLIPMTGGNVAYLRIMEFSPNTLPRVKDAIKAFDASGYKAMVIDLRSNPGGLLQSATQIADLFMDAGPIVSTKGRSAYENTVINARPDLSVPKNKPIVVLINKGSASAAEILAGALKDTKRAYLVGENSYGKGSVQQIIPVDDTGFKLTMARYYTPSDENIDKTGIPPDRVSPELDLNSAATLALQALAEDGAVETWAKAHQGASVDERNAFAAKLKATPAFSALPEQLLRRLVRDELARTTTPPAYDLEFDTTLADALKVLADPNYDALLAATKTVKELVAAKKASQAALPATPGTKKK